VCVGYFKRTSMQLFNVSHEHVLFFEKKAIPTTVLFEETVGASMSLSLG